MENKDALQNNVVLKVVPQIKSGPSRTTTKSTALRFLNLLENLSVVELASFSNEELSFLAKRYPRIMSRVPEPMLSLIQERARLSEYLSIDALQKFMLQKPEKSTKHT